MGMNLLSQLPLIAHTGRPDAVEYLIGVDGGGSGTRARLCALDGAVLGEAEAGPSSLGQGIAAAWNNIEQAIDGAIKVAARADATPARCALGLGLAGAHVRAYRESLLQRTGAFGCVVLDTDSFAALVGAHGDRAGVLMALGTGSVGEARRLDGARVAVGGWGFGVGDEGSGAWLGLGAMRVAQHALDGRAVPKALAESVWKIAGASRDALHAWCSSAGQNAYAQLAPLVFAAAPRDPAAKELLDQACASVEEHVRALDPTGLLPVALHGSIGKRIAPLLPPQLRARLVAPDADALVGAVHIVSRALKGIRA